MAGLSVGAREGLITEGRLVEWLTGVKRSHGTLWLHRFLDHLDWNFEHGLGSGLETGHSPDRRGQLPSLKASTAPELPESRESPPKPAAVAFESGSLGRHQLLPYMDSVPKIEPNSLESGSLPPRAGLHTILGIELELSVIAQAASRLFDAESSTERLAAPASAVFTRVAWQGVRVCRSAAEREEASQKTSLKHLLAQAQVLEAALMALDETPDFSPDLEARARLMKEEERASKWGPPTTQSHSDSYDGGGGGKREQALRDELSQVRHECAEAMGEAHGLRVCLAEAEGMKEEYGRLQGTHEAVIGEAEEEIGALRDQVAAEQNLTDHANEESLRAKERLSELSMELEAMQQVLQETDSVSIYSNK